MSWLKFLEPEEAIGSLWHRFVERLDAEPRFPEAAVSLEEMQSRLSVFFHGLGGAGGVDIVAAAPEGSRHRLSFKRRLGREEEREVPARLDAEHLALPGEIDFFPERAENEKLFLWLSAWAAHAGEAPDLPDDPLQADIAILRHMTAISTHTLALCPGLAGSYRMLASALLLRRGEQRLPPVEAALEAVVRRLLGADAALEGEAADLLAAVEDGKIELEDFEAPYDYHPFRSVPLWPDHRPLRFSNRRRDGAESGGGGGSEGEKQRRRAQRRSGDQADRKDSLILNRFETIMSWTEFLNLNRQVEDEDESAAKKAADDHDEIGLANVDKRPATKLAFDLDMAPADVDREKLSGEYLYPEWDYRIQGYHRDHCRVLASVGAATDKPPAFLDDPETRRRIRAVKRRFEALKPKRMSLPRQPDGDDLDMEALVRSIVDLKVTGEGSDRVYKAIRNEARDLAVAILVDTSRSTESVVEERPVIDIAREALIAFSHGLQAVGDDHAIYSFSSLRRERIFINTCKAFDEPLGPAVEGRLAALTPGFYTRLGAAIRHVSAELAKRPSQRRLLLILTDGKPNDLDHYEGRYGVEDCRRAVMEARRVGHAVFAVTIDKQARDYVTHVFGRNGHAIVSRPSRLAEALPPLYQHLVS